MLEFRTACRRDDLSKGDKPWKGASKQRQFTTFPMKGVGLTGICFHFLSDTVPREIKTRPLLPISLLSSWRKQQFLFSFSLVSQSLCHFPIWLAPQSESIFLIFSQGFDTTTQHTHYRATSQETPSLFLSPAQTSNNKKHWGHPTSKKEEQNNGKGAGWGKRARICVHARRFQTGGRRKPSNIKWNPKSYFSCSILWRTGQEQKWEDNFNLRVTTTCRPCHIILKCLHREVVCVWWGVVI